MLNKNNNFAVSKETQSNQISYSSPFTSNRFHQTESLGLTPKSTGDMEGQNVEFNAETFDTGTKQLLSAQTRLFDFILHNVNTDTQDLIKGNSDEIVCKFHCLY